MEIRIDRKSRIATVDLGELSTLPEVEQAVQALRDHPEYVDGMDAIYDCSRADLSAFRTRELQLLADFAKSRVSRTPHRVAIVVKRDLEFGVARMWEFVSGDEFPHQERRVFRDLAEAREWLLSSRDS